MRWLADQHGCRRFALLGMCAGAEIAFKTACQDPRVGAVVLILTAVTLNTGGRSRTVARRRHADGTETVEERRTDTL